MRVDFVKMTMNVFWEHILAINWGKSSSVGTQKVLIVAKESDVEIVSLLEYLQLHAVTPLKSNQQTVIQL